MNTSGTLRYALSPNFSKESTATGFISGSEAYCTTGALPTMIARSSGSSSSENVSCSDSYALGSPSRAKVAATVTELFASSNSWIWHCWQSSASAAVRATVFSTSSRSTLEVIAFVDSSSESRRRFCSSRRRSIVALRIATAACSPRARGDLSLVPR